MTKVTRSTLEFPDWNVQLVVHDLGVLLDGELSVTDHFDLQCLWEVCERQADWLAGRQIERGMEVHR